jgi:hypothetical protein
MKYMRRPDLTIPIRARIALEAMANKGSYGYITELSKSYKVSRTFIYSLLYVVFAALFEEFNFINSSRNSGFTKQLLDKQILMLRLQNNSSIESISDTLKYDKYYPASVGYISERLSAYGQELLNTLKSESPILSVWIPDEIFALNKPILITIDPISMAILRIELAKSRDCETWDNHFKQILNNNFSPIKIVSDRGPGIVKAAKTRFDNIIYQPDIFHDFRSICKRILVTLEKSAYKAIAYEYEREAVILSSVTKEVKEKRVASYKEARKKATKAIELYDDSYYLLREIQKCLEIIDERGCVKKAEQVSQDILACLELLGSLGDEEVTLAAASLKNNLDEILRYMKQAEEVYEYLCKKIGDEEVVKAFCIAWHSDHKVWQNPSTKQKAYLKDLRDTALQYCELILKEQYKEIKEYVFMALDNIVRVSSLIEAVNSLIRPYLNMCKGQITQQTLNLIMFYHNHRKFRHGKRKAKSPIEILTGVKSDKHWVDILVETAGILA